MKAEMIVAGYEMIPDPGLWMLDEYVRGKE